MITTTSDATELSPDAAQILNRLENPLADGTIRFTESAMSPDEGFEEDFDTAVTEFNRRHPQLKAATGAYELSASFSIHPIHVRPRTALGIAARNLLSSIIERT